MGNQFGIFLCKIKKEKHLLLLLLLLKLLLQYWRQNEVYFTGVTYQLLHPGGCWLHILMRGCCCIMILLMLTNIINDFDQSMLRSRWSYTIGNLYWEYIRMRKCFWDTPCSHKMTVFIEVFDAHIAVDEFQSGYNKCRWVGDAFPAFFNHRCC